MKERVFLVIYLFKLPFKFPLGQTASQYENALKIRDVDIESHIDYLSEYGSVVSRASKSGTAKNVWISNNSSRPSAREEHFYEIFGYPLGNRLDVTNLLTSRLSNTQSLTHQEGLNPLEFKFRQDRTLPHLELSEPENPRIVEKIDAIDITGSTNMDNMYFEASNITFNLIKFVLKIGGSPKIVMNYSELQRTPLLLVLFLHLPILLTSAIIVVLVLSFDSGVSKDVIQDEISKLPLQKYSTMLEFTECPICLEAFVTEEEVRVLSCKHCFHKLCIDSWLRSMLKCPICRNSVTKLADSENYTFYQTLNGLA